MSEYFSNFPRILYDINGTNQTSPDFSVAVNLMVRQKLRDAIKNEITIYYPYVIPEEIKRPDILSFQTYGDVKFTWTIFLLNQILDPYWQWPMDSKTFQAYLTDKYGSVQESKITVHHYEYIQQARVEITGTTDVIPERILEVDEETYLSTNQDFRRIKYAYEYELDKNESYREINLIDPLYISGVLDEARGVFR
tara:strand:+ start:20 stop:604 length:585 start_codon:yes stop_codon:yes gene_type:complete